jgi:hypothetical protein
VSTETSIEPFLPIFHCLNLEKYEIGDCTNIKKICKVANNFRKSASLTSENLRCTSRNVTSLDLRQEIVRKNDVCIAFMHLKT